MSALESAQFIRFATNTNDNVETLEVPSYPLSMHLGRIQDSTDVKPYMVQNLFSLFPYNYSYRSYSLVVPLRFHPLYEVLCLPLGSSSENDWGNYVELGRVLLQSRFQRRTVARYVYKPQNKNILMLGFLGNEIYRLPNARRNGGNPEEAWTYINDVITITSSAMTPMDKIGDAAMYSRKIAENLLSCL